MKKNFSRRLGKIRKKTRPNCGRVVSLLLVVVSSKSKINRKYTGRICRSMVFSFFQQQPKIFRNEKRERKCVGNNNITRRLESRKSITIIRIGATTTILTLNQIIWFSHGQSTCIHYFFKYFKERRNC